jgi:hypothetical protein
LSAEQQAQIPGLLASGAEAHGFRGNVWTAKRLVIVIWRHFGVRYHPDHVVRLLRRLGWSRQQPRERAAQRDEEAIQLWQEERWPALKKKAVNEGFTIVWGTNRRSICCRTPCERGRHGATRHVCVSNSARIISPPSAA